jgi:hypothetical protein
VGQLLLLDHHHLLVPLHHHLLLLRDSLHVPKVHAHASAHHLLLLHHHHMLAWIELGCVSCLTSLVLLGVLLHLLEGSLLRDHALLKFELLNLRVITLFLCLLDLEVKHSELPLLDGKWVLLVIIS